MGTKIAIIIDINKYLANYFHVLNIHVSQTAQQRLLLEIINGNEIIFKHKIELFQFSELYNSLHAIDFVERINEV